MNILCPAALTYMLSRNVLCRHFLLYDFGPSHSQSYAQSCLSVVGPVRCGHINEIVPAQALGWGWVCVCVPRQDISVEMMAQSFDIVRAWP